MVINRHVKAGSLNLVNKLEEQNLRAQYKQPEMFILTI